MNNHEDFWDRIDKTDSCWWWSGGRTAGGRYGAFSFLGKTWRAHRMSYSITYGGIPLGMVVCHKCNNTLCVNPAHLYAATQRENILQAKREGRMAGVALNRLKTHCIHGHEFSEFNTMRRSDGFRECRACRKIYKAKYYRRICEAAQ